jgi:hypothetical protein
MSIARAGAPDGVALPKVVKGSQCFLSVFVIHGMATKKLPPLIRE